MTYPSPPLHSQGYIDSDIAWGHVLGDFLETVPAVLWPLSIQTYADMRRDAQLTAVLAAYMLPIRRATWALDPAGCRPEVAALVADDLGLPLLGADKPGGARVRGVSWREHLRASLLCLVYGHMPFEMGAEIRDGKARLTSLSERMPHTIGQIHVDPIGNLTGITQHGTTSVTKAPQIASDRLVWYAHDREGASWQGTSLLRPAYAPWLLKREMMRVHATSNRRFGMGVPTVEWATGTSPTPGQIAQAQQAASAARVGDQAGLALPPGAHLVLAGLNGSVPDTLAFMKWLDVQMSRMALAGFIDLGETTHGSRALGQTFIDLLIMSLQSVAEDLADTVTRQAAARVVEWNWGVDEPVPRVAVADIGSRREVTAEALQLLLSSGALSPDPALEEFIRREYRLPGRAIPWVQPKPATSSKPNNSPLAAKRAAAGQLELPIAAASAPQWDLSPDEVASGADFAQMQQDQQDAEAAVRDLWPDLAAPIIAALVAAAGAAVVAGALADLGSLVVPAAAIAAVTDALTAAMTALAKTAAERVVAEAASQGVALAAGVPDEAVLAGHAAAVANVLASGYANGAARTALLNAGPGSTAADVEFAVRTNLEDLAKADGGFVNTATGSALATAAHTGRVATLTKAPATTAFVATEVLDGNECKPCAEISGHRFATLADANAAYPAGHYVACLGRERCRGTVLAIFNP